MTDHEPDPGRALEDFLQVFCARVEETTQPVSCLQLYRHYLKHCMSYRLPMAGKARFAAGVYDTWDLLPSEPRCVNGLVVRFFDGLRYTGEHRLLRLPYPGVVQELLNEPSLLDYEPAEKRPGDRHRARKETV